MSWEVMFHRKAEKQKRDLPKSVQEKLAALVFELEVAGPIRGNWKNYSKLSGEQHHCHLKAGRPTYVACWEVKDKKVQILEVYYVGTHEKAPY